MEVLRNERMPVKSEEDVVRVRQVVRQWAVQMRFGLVDQTKIVTAASELARNALIHGGGGEVELASIQNDRSKGLKLTFSDNGPGIADIAQAMKDGYTTGTGLGLGLSGSKRLMNDFDIDSAPGKGTRITVIKWI
jgi:serine/threonine-protein kinase RsbT